MSGHVVLTNRDKEKTVRGLARWTVVGMAVVLCSAAASVVGLQAGTSGSRAAAYSSEISIEPAPKHEGAFLCKALIKDVGTGEVAAAPAVVFAAGDSAETESALTEDGPTFVLHVKVDALGGSAEYEVSVRSGGVQQLLHSGRVILSTNS
jgi:hypothetical protein